MLGRERGVGTSDGRIDGWIVRHCVRRQLDGKVNAVRSHVIHFHNRAFRDLPLDAEIPLLHIRKRAGLGESVVIGESERILRRAELSDVRRGFCTLLVATAGKPCDSLNGCAMPVPKLLKACSTV